LQVGAWVRGWFVPARRSKSTRQAAALRHRRALFEPLEGRRLLSGQSLQWIGNTQNWSSPSNWNDISTPGNTGSAYPGSDGAGDTLIFNANNYKNYFTTTNDLSALSLASIQIIGNANPGPASSGGDNLTISGSAVTLTGSITLSNSQASSNSATNNYAATVGLTGIALSGNETWSNSRGTLNVTAPISMSGATLLLNSATSGTTATSTDLSGNITNLSDAGSTPALKNTGGGTLTLGSVSLAGPATLYADTGSILNVNSGTLSLGAYTLTVSGAGATNIGDAVTGTGGVTMSGTTTGTLTLSGSNSYLGLTTVSGGTLTPLANASLTTGGILVTANSSGVGGALALAGGINVSEPVTINGSGPTGGGAIEHITASLNMTPGLEEGQIDAQNNWNVAQTNPDQDTQQEPLMGETDTVENGGAYYPTSSHVWADNDTWIYSGDVYFPDSNGNGTGTLSFAKNIDDSAFLAVNGTTYISNGSWITPLSSGPITLPTGWYPIQMQFANGDFGAGPSDDGAPGWNSSYGFGVRVDSGPSDANASQADGDYYIIPENGNLNVNYAAGGAFPASDFPNGDIFEFGSQTATVAGRITLGSNATIGSDCSDTLDLGNISLTGGSLTFTGGGSTVAQSAISGPNGIVMAGSGTATLAAANSYGGTTTVNSGTLVADNSQSLGTATGNVATVANGGALGLPLTGGVALPASQGISIAGSGPSGNGAIEDFGGADSVAGAITVSSTAAIGSDSGGTLTLSGSIATTGGSLTFTGGGSTVAQSAISGPNGVVMAGLGTATLAAAQQLRRRDRHRQRHPDRRQQPVAGHRGGQRGDRRQRRRPRAASHGRRRAAGLPRDLHRRPRPVRQRGHREPRRQQFHRRPDHPQRRCFDRFRRRHADAERKHRHDRRRLELCRRRQHRRSRPCQRLAVGGGGNRR
jgi:fibronectin-binding autotransporter adhesin